MARFNLFVILMSVPSHWSARRPKADADALAHPLYTPSTSDRSDVDVNVREGSRDDIDDHPVYIDGSEKREAVNQHVFRVRGPVSLHGFRVPVMKRAEEGEEGEEDTPNPHVVILVFGDYHNHGNDRYRKKKEPRSSEREYGDGIEVLNTDTSDFIELVRAKCAKERMGFDLFIEVPYIVSMGKLREHFMKIADIHMSIPGENHKDRRQQTGKSDESKRKRRGNDDGYGDITAAVVEGKHNKDITEKTSSCRARILRRFCCGLVNPRIASRQKAIKRKKRIRRIANHSHSYSPDPDPNPSNDINLDLDDVIRKLYRCYKRELYYARSDTNLCFDFREQFHGTDVRWEPNTWMYMKVPRNSMPELLSRWFFGFHSYVGDVTTYRKIIETFLFSTDFVKDMRKIYGKHAPIATAALIYERVMYAHRNGGGGGGDDTSRECREHVRRMHPIAYEYHLLPPDYARLVAYYFAARLDSVSDLMRHELQYDHFAKLFHDKNSGENGDDHRELNFSESMREMLVNKIRQQKLMAYKSGLLMITRFVIPVLLMDAYLLFRVLRFIYREPKYRTEVRDREGRRDEKKNTATGYIIVYAGNAHACNYVDFFRQYMGLAPIVEVPARVVAAPNQDDDDTAGSETDAAAQGNTVGNEDAERDRDGGGCVDMVRHVDVEADVIF